MPNQPRSRPLGESIKALRQEGIDGSLIGMMAAVRHGATATTWDYDFWVRLPERQYVRLLTIVHRLGGKILARTMYELPNGIQVNAIFRPDGLRSFEAEYKRCTLCRIEGQPVRLLPLDRVIASKKASGREKDIATLPMRQKVLRCSRRLARRKT
jgi:hypothetical protein